MATQFLHRPIVWTAATGAIGLTIAAATYNHESRAAALSTAPLTFSSFTTLKLESTEQLTHNVKRLRFALPSDTPASLPLVSSLLTRHTPAGGLIPVFRPYTPISTTSGHITFLVKLYPNGRASGKMHSLRAGDSMSFKSLHELEYTPNQFASMTFIAGGSGITPIYQLASTILGDPQEKTRLRLVYANNSPGDILLRDEFDALAKEYPGRFEATYVVSKDAEGSGMRSGYVTKELLAEVIPPKEGEGKVKVLVSGPPAMTAAVAGGKGGFGWTQGSMGGILKELGYTKEEVHKF